MLQKTIQMIRIDIKNSLRTKYLTPFITVKQLVHTSTSRRGEQKPDPETVRAKDILEDLQEPELTEEEIMQKRFKSRLPERMYKMYVQKQALPIETKYDFEKFRLRQYWGRFGKESKLNPGILWPTREQILNTIEEDKTFEPPLQERLRNVQSRKQEEQRLKQEYENEVEENMANLDTWIAEFHSKNQKREEKIQQLRKDRERLVEEVSEYLGYDIDPKDPRFKEAVEQKEKEKKKALKVKKQQESYEKMLDKLKKIAQSSSQ